MDYSYFVILAISTTMLVLLLVIFGAMLSTKKSDFVFPNTPNQCPDSWPIWDDGCLYLPEGLEEEMKKLRANDSKTYINNYDRIKPLLDRAKNIGKNNGTLNSLNRLQLSQTPLDSHSNIWDFKPGSVAIHFNESATLCDKKKWSNFYGIKWDGVSNFNHCD
jgi:hypothetical protein